MINLDPKEGSGLKTQSVKVPDQGNFYSASLCNHSQAWLKISKDLFITQAITEGVKIPLKGSPPTRSPSQEELAFRSKDPVVEEAVSELLHLGAVVEVPADSEVFLSKVFTVPKLERGQEYGRRFILNLKVSNHLPSFD